VGLEVPVTVLFWFDRQGEFVDAKCDAAFPATRSGTSLDFIDLDLDVIVLPGLQHYVRDQEVFAERSVTMAYSESAKQTAHIGILHSLRMVRRRQFPFDGHAERLIRELLGGTARPK
jgi:protein associated with RNAse G/E